MDFKDLWMNTGLTEKQIRRKLHLTHGQISDYIHALNLPERTERGEVNLILDRIKDEYTADPMNKTDWLNKYQLSDLTLEILWDKLKDTSQERIYDKVLSLVNKKFRDGLSVIEISKDLNIPPVSVLRCILSVYPGAKAKVRYRLKKIYKDIKQLREKTLEELSKDRDKEVQRLEKVVKKELKGGINGSR
jgi:hypothetical protein